MSDETKTAKDKAAELADSIAKKTTDGIVAGLAPAFAALTEAIKGTKAVETPVVAKETVALDGKAQKEADEKVRMDAFEERMKANMEKFVKDAGLHDGRRGSMNALLGMGKNDGDDVQVKAVTSKYSTDRRPALREKGIFTGQRMRHNGKDLEHASEFIKVMCGVWFKYQVGGIETLTENDLLVFKHILHREKFLVDSDAGIDDVAAPARLLKDFERELFTKAPLIADGTSGGTSATPQFFDENFIILPILGNKLSPFVTMTDMARGNVVTTFTMANPTFAARTAEGSAITAFDATSFIAAKTFTVYGAAGGVEIGINFLQDAVPGLEDRIRERYSAKAAEWLDEQIAIGNGTTAPKGVFNESGTADITFTNVTVGPYTITDFLNLYFGVSLPYRQAFPLSKCAWIGTDTGYKKLRSISTGISGDTRLIFGDDISSYSVFGCPFAVVGTVVTNDDFAFVQCGGYRLYRRQGLMFRRTDQGITLAKNNSVFVSADMRFAGGLERGGYAAVSTSGIP